MPIAQDRILALIAIADEILQLHSKLRTLISAETQAATNDYYEAEAQGQDALASASSTILSRLQAIEAIVNEPYLSPAAIETLSREREHFRLTRARNDRARASAIRRRKGLNYYRDTREVEL